MKQRTQKIIASLVGMAFAVALVFAFTAKVDAADTNYYGLKTELTAGKKYVIAVQDGTTWKALSSTDHLTSSGSEDKNKYFDAANVTVNEDGDLIDTPDSDIIWTCGTASEGSGQNRRDGYMFSNTTGDLYLTTEGLKYQNNPRPLEYVDGNLYLYTLSGNHSNYHIYVSYASDKFAASWDEENNDQAVAKAGAATIVLFEQMTEDEYTDYANEKAAAALNNAKKNAKAYIDAKQCSAELKTTYKGKVDAATSETEVTAAINEFDQKVAEEQSTPSTDPVAEAKQKAETNIKNAKCDQAIKDKYLEQLKNADSTAKVDEIYAAFEKEVKESGGEAAPATPTTDAKEEQKKATDEINKIAADTSKYDADEAKAIKDAAANYIIKINSTTNVTEIKNLVSAFNAEIKALPTTADKQALAKIAVKMKKIKVGKKKMTVKWTPKKANFDGYEISYQIKGKKKVKTATVKKATASKKVIKKLKKGKKYKVKVRGYKLYGQNKDIKVYGKWSKAKTSKKIK